MSPSLIWFRDDLRLDDNPALMAAAADGPVTALFVLEDGIGWRPLGGAARWWLHHSLQALGASLAEAGVALVLRRGDPRVIVPSVVAATGARSVHWNRRYLPWTKPLDAAVKSSLTASGIAAQSHNGSLLVEPRDVASGSGGPYKVFTPFFRAIRERAAIAAGACTAASALVPGPSAASDALADWKLLPSKPDWSGGLAALWTPGEAGAKARLSAFVDTALAHYPEGRDFPGRDHTSRLSPHLRFGEISVRRAWAAAALAAAERPAVQKGADKFHTELGWREFSWHLLHHFEDFTTQNWRREFDRFPWAASPEHVEAWRCGRTGYPIVDAGMRQLWQTGWMHNRVRMIVGSFLVKHLLTDWRTGEDWFWDTLVDADPASNAAGWQWIAGCGADAAPYFRVFNPMTQGQKFDPDGHYVRRFVPELARLPNAVIHAPWTAPREILASSGVSLGTVYPWPIVEHAKARQSALDAYQTLKAGAGETASGEEAA